MTTQFKKKFLLSIQNALFYKGGSRKTGKEFIFSKPIEQFRIACHDDKPTFWGVIGPRKSDFLRVVASKYCSEPPLARTYPLFSDGGLSKKIQYIDFRDTSGLDKCHMAARYESYSYKGQLEMADDVNSVLNYVTGANNYNNNSKCVENDLAKKLLVNFDLSDLQSKWINTLSNGQMRRARMAKAIQTRPHLLVIDDPFLGLDPKATSLVSQSLKRIALDLNISIVVGLRNLEEMPDWVTNVAYVDVDGLTKVDEEYSVEKQINFDFGHKRAVHSLNAGPYHLREISAPSVDQPFIEFKNASVIYKSVPVLLNFDWKVEKGSTWRISGENGSGKTTILSLITAEHPQSWRSVLSIDGVVRKPGSGVNYFDINNKIGISSPELHAVVPFGMHLYQVALNGMVTDVGNSNFRVSYKQSKIPPYAQSIFHHFESELSGYADIPFNEVSVSLQKLALFLRAIVKRPEILILDEAFSGMDEDLVTKCHSFIARDLRDTTILTIGHLDWEVPSHDFVLKLSGGSDRSVKYFATSM